MRPIDIPGDTLHVRTGQVQGVMILAAPEAKLVLWARNQSGIQVFDAGAAAAR